MIIVKKSAKVSIIIACLCSFAAFSANSSTADSYYDSGLLNFALGHYEAAMDDFYKAAGQGEEGAAHMLMRMHSEGHVASTSKNEAFRWTLVAAEEGMANAQFKAGQMYLQQPDVANGQKQALFWFSKAVKQGHISAHYELAQMYQHGLGVPVDKERAHDLYLYAASELDVFAQKGDPKAQTRLALLYEQGLGVPVNIGLAFKWMKRAAAVHNYAEAQFNLARLLALVNTEPRHPEEAVYWVNRAVSQGYTKAEALRGELEDRWPEFASR